MALEQHTITVAGRPRCTGWKPTPPDTITRLRDEGKIVLASEHPALKAGPKADWIEADCSHFWTKRLDQDGQGACVGFSAAHALQVALAKEGFADLHISPAAIYGAINGGYDDGANVGDSADLLTKHGAFLDGTEGIGDLDWKKVWKSKWWQNPSSSLAVAAARYVVLEFVLCETIDEFTAALKTGQWTGQHCMGAGNNFDTDANGFLPKCDGTPINHALCTLGGAKQNPKTGEWCLQGANSWSDWGLNQVFYFGLDWLDMPRQEMWLIRSTTLPEAP